MPHIYLRVCINIYIYTQYIMYIYIYMYSNNSKCMYICIVHIIIYIHVFDIMKYDHSHIIKFFPRFNHTAWTRTARTDRGRKSSSSSTRVSWSASWTLRMWRINFYSVSFLQCHFLKCIGINFCQFLQCLVFAHKLGSSTKMFVLHIIFHVHTICTIC